MSSSVDDMRMERNRIMTFRNWPSNAPVEPDVVARCGFYATGKGMEVICHWCNKKISTWELGEQIMQKHRRLNPLCSFVTNPLESGNVPMSSGLQQNSSSIVSSVAADQTNINAAPPVPDTTPVDLKNEQYRLSTFKNWPLTYIQPASLAKAGFYYLQLNDRVRCAWCNIVVGQWVDGDNPFSEHQRLVPDCPKVQLGPNIEVASDGIRELGIQQIRSPKEPRYSSLDARLRTYSTWSTNNVQKAESLAEAGFYYQGVDDQVRCFHCNGGLRYWLTDDDPWFEHARWFPKCQFVPLVKGIGYVKNIQEQRANECTPQASVQNPVMSLDEVMSTDNVQLVLQMGLNEGRIRAAVKKRLAKMGKPFQTAEALIEHVLDGQFDEDYSTEELPAPTTLDYLANTPIQRVTSNPSYIFTPLSSNNRSINNQPRYMAQSSTEPCAPVKPVAESTNLNLDVTISEPAIDESTTESDQNPDKLQVLLEEENRKLKDARLCKVCMDDEVGVVFLPCGHLVTCVQCAPGVSMCPLCRSPIKGFVRTFLS